MPVDFQESTIDFEPTVDFKPEEPTEPVTPTVAGVEPARTLSDIPFATAKSMLSALGQAWKEAAITPAIAIPRPAPEEDDLAITSFGKGLAEAGIEVVEGAETPLGVATLGAALLPGIGKL